MRLDVRSTRPPRIIFKVLTGHMLLSVGFIKDYMYFQTIVASAIFHVTEQMSWLGFPNLNQYCQSPPERCWFQPLACYSFHYFSWSVAIGIVSSDVETCCTFWWMNGTVWHQSKSSYAKSTAVGRRSSQCLSVKFPNRLRIEDMSRIGCSYQNHIYAGSASSAALSVVQFCHNWLSLS
jgi:hypothetical protein